ncbi:MAG: uracil phosphoribosyltransferase [Bacteroidota bacterium]
MFFTLHDSPSIGNQFLVELRDQTIQRDTRRFRENLKRIGQILAYEISKTLTFEDRVVESVLGEAQTRLPKDEIVLATVLRAGIPFYQGFQDMFDRAESAFVGAMRQARTDDAVEIDLHYLATTDLRNKILILVDPMLATGKSIVKSYHELTRVGGVPKSIHLAAVIAARAGVEYVQNELPDAHIWLGALDETLNSKSYIVPGLGDAGDLAFGAKR